MNLQVIWGRGARIRLRMMIGGRFVVMVRIRWIGCSDLGKVVVEGLGCWRVYGICRFGFGSHGLGVVDMVMRWLGTVIG